MVGVQRTLLLAGSVQLAIACGGETSSSDRTNDRIRDDSNAGGGGGAELMPSAGGTTGGDPEQNDPHGMAGAAVEVSVGGNENAPKPDVPTSGRAGAAGEPTPEAPEADSVPIPEACWDFATTLCSLHAACPGASYSEEYCVKLEVSRCADRLGFAGSALSAENMPACLEDMVSSDCARLRARYRSIDSCVSAPGTLQTDAECYWDHQCESGDCRGESGRSCGTCQEEGLISTNRLPWVHEPVENIGEPPADGNQCGNQYLMLVDGLCQLPPSEEGAACELQCDALVDLSCVPVDPAAPDGARECRRQPILSPGANCGGEVLGRCEDGWVCKSMSDLGTGNCGQVNREGEACSFDDYYCELGTTCDYSDDGTSGTCVNWEASGASPVTFACGR